VSVARIDLRTSRFEIAADAGAELLAPGTALPLSTCSYFAQVSEGRAFHDDDFDRSRAFDRPVDGVILATGFHSGCSVPLRDGGEVVGAISLSTSRRGQPMAELVAELEPLADVLVAQIDGLRIEAAVRALRSAERARSVEVLTAREQELLECLEEGLRFKQVAHRLGISQATAKTHARNLFRQLDANSRGEAVHAARVRGLLA
jgi:DNA-binding NarL/FixJ family response regulator